MSTTTNSAAQTPGPMIVMFGGVSCALHLAARAADTSARNRILVLPRDHSKGDADPNVIFLRTLAAAPKLLSALREIQANPNNPRAHRWALDAIADVTGRTP